MLAADQFPLDINTPLESQTSLCQKLLSSTQVCLSYNTDRTTYNAFWTHRQGRPFSGPSTWRDQGVTARAELRS